MVDQKLIQKLRDKGWTEEDINNTVKIMERIENASGGHQKRFNVVLYWAVLFIAILGNFILSVVLIPFLLVLSNYQLYFIILLVGASFGLLFNIIIREIEYLDTKNHIIPGIFIPAIAIINISIMTDLSNYLMKVSNIDNTPHNPFAISIIYVVFFIIPYLIHKTVELAKKQKPNNSVNQNNK